MIIGLEFEIENEYDTFIEKILKDTCFPALDWKIYTDSIIRKGEDGKEIDGLFPIKEISGMDFQQRISENLYYLIFADLKGYKADSDKKDIDSYSDFVNSNCEIVVLCVDSIYISVFCKNNSDLLAIKENCKRNNFKDVKEIADIEAISHYFRAF